MRYEYMPIQAIKYVSKRTGIMSVGRITVLDSYQMCRISPNQTEVRRTIFSGNGKFPFHPKKFCNQNSS